MPGYGHCVYTPGAPTAAKILFRQRSLTPKYRRGVSSVTIPTRWYLAPYVPMPLWYLSLVTPQGSSKVCAKYTPESSQVTLMTSGSLGRPMLPKAHALKLLPEKPWHTSEAMPTEGKLLSTARIPRKPGANQSNRTMVPAGATGPEEFCPLKAMPTCER